MMKENRMSREVEAESGSRESRESRESRDEAEKMRSLLSSAREETERRILGKIGEGGVRDEKIGGK